VDPQREEATPQRDVIYLFVFDTHDANFTGVKSASAFLSVSKMIIRAFAWPSLAAV
jgi:hypothetical protein